MQTRNSKYALEHLVMLISGYTKKNQPPVSYTAEVHVSSNWAPPENQMREPCSSGYNPTLQSLTVWLLSGVKQNTEFKALEKHWAEISGYVLKKHPHKQETQGQKISFLFPTL